MGKRRREPSTELAPAETHFPRDPSLLTDIRQLIESARQQVAQAVNAGLVTLYWHIGRRIRQEVLAEQRAT